MSDARRSTHDDGRQPIAIGHLSDSGDLKILSRSRELLYWPGMSQQIKDLAQQCDICNRHRNKQTKQPFQQHIVPKRQRQKLATEVAILTFYWWIVIQGSLKYRC